MLFSLISRETPSEPVRGLSSDVLTTEGRKFMEDNLRINASQDVFHRYKDLCLKYHDVFSKSKFDLGRTDVVEHKVTLKSEDPIHVCQFRMALWSTYSKIPVLPKRVEMKIFFDPVF